MRTLLVLLVVVIPIVVQAQEPKCPKGYQPYANRCVTQRMADYISCIEASGGNRDEISEEITHLTAGKTSGGVKGSGGGVIAKGSGAVLLDKASEKVLAKKLATKWFPKGMDKCAQFLDKTTARDIKKTIKQAIQENTVQTSGLLVPGNMPTPTNLPCYGYPFSKDDMIVIYGNSVSFTNSSPTTILKVGSERLLSYDKKNGKVALSGRFFSDDGKIVAELRNNQFDVNPNNYFRIERPTKHQLLVYDQKGNEALNVNYINASTIKILGRFNIPSAPPIILSEEGMKTGRGIMSGNCSGHANTVIQF